MEWLYANDANNTCRYILGVVGSRPLICVGVNPSTAEPDNLDNTLKSVARIAAQNGYDGWIMINLYPQRATNPNDLHKTFNEESSTANTLHIQELLTQYPSADLWAAWGTLIEKRAYLKNCLAHINRVANKCNCNWVSFGRKSKNGHPHHPLYLRIDSPKSPFDMSTYQSLQQKRAN